MSRSVRTGLVYAIVVVGVFVVGLIVDSGLVLLLAGVLAVVGVVRAFRERSLAIEDAQAEAESLVRDGNAEPERHSF